MSSTANTILPSSHQDGDAWSAQANLYSSQSGRITELHAADLVALLKTDILQAKRILDVGCGTGAFGQAYLQQFPTGIPGQTIIFSDLSKGMVEKAQENLQPPSNKDMTYQTTFSFQVADGTTLNGIEDDSIDLVVSSFGAFMIPNQRAAFRSIYRVLSKPNGKFANASWQFGISNNLKELGVGPSLQDVFFLPMKVLDPKAYEEKLAGVANWSTIEGITNHVKMTCTAGDDESIMIPFGTPRTIKAIHTSLMDWDMYWQVIEKNPVTSDVYAAASEDEKKAAKEKVLDFMKDHNQDDPIQNSMVLSAISLLSIISIQT